MSVPTALPPKNPQAPSQPPLGSETIEFLWKIHSYLNEYIRFADAKAGTAATLFSALLAALISTNIHQTLVKVPVQSWRVDHLWPAAAFSLLTLATLLAAWVIIPRLWKDRQRGLIFWEDIVAHGTSSRYWEAVAAARHEEMSQQVASHLFILSQVCSRKHRLIGWSIRLGLVGALAALYAVLFNSNP